MRRKPYPIVELTGGLNVSLEPIHIQDSESVNLSLVRYHKKTIKKDFAFSTHANLTSERVMGFHVYRQYDEDLYVICFGVDKAYQYTAGAWSAISGASPVFTGAEDDMFFSTTFDDLLIVTNGKDAIQKWNGTTWANLGGSPPSAARYMIPFYSRLILLYTTESATDYPHRIRWSIVGDPETWTGTGSGAIDVLETQDRITGVARLGDRVFVFKEDSIWELYYVGGTDVFKVRMISTDVGCRAGKTVVAVGTSLLFVGSNNVYSFDGATFSEIGSPIYPYMFETLDRTASLYRINRAHAIFDYEAGQYIVAVPTVDNATPNIILKYDLRGKFWTRRSKECTAMGYLLRGLGTSVAWSAATSAWNGGSWGVPWAADVLGLPFIMYGGPTGVVQKDDKQTVSSETLIWETKDFVLARATRIVGMRYMVKGSGTFTASYSYDEGQTWTVPVNLTPTSSVYFTEVFDPLNYTSLKIRVKIEAANTFELQWVLPLYIERQRPL